MSNFTTLAKELVAFEEASKMLEISKLKFETKLNESMNLLHSVGNSVLQKYMGMERYKALNPRYVSSELSRKNAWLLIHEPEFSFRLWRTDPTKGEIIVKGHTLSGDYLGYSMSSDLISVSVRNFAKEVRAAQDEVIKNYRLSEIAIAHEIIQREDQRVLKEQRKMRNREKSNKAFMTIEAEL